MTTNSGGRYRDNEAIASVFFGSLSTSALFISVWVLILNSQAMWVEEACFPFLFVDAICSFISIVMARASLEKSNRYPGTRETGTARIGLVLGIIGALAPAGVFVMVMYYYAMVRYLYTRPGW